MRVAHINQELLKKDCVNKPYNEFDLKKNMINDAFGGDKYLSLGRKIYVLA